MNRLSLPSILLAACLSTTGWAAFAEIPTGPMEGSRIPAKIHVIQNFEDWNDVMIRISGVFRNGCFEKLGTTATVQGDQILVENRVRYNAGSICTMALVPYSGQVAVRNLKEGTYDVLVMDKNGEYQEMTSFKTE